LILRIDFDRSGFQCGYAEQRLGIVVAKEEEEEMRATPAAVSSTTASVPGARISSSNSLSVYSFFSCPFPCAFSYRRPP
jgi:hypothetical protein